MLEKVRSRMRRKSLYILAFSLCSLCSNLIYSQDGIQGKDKLFKFIEGLQRIPVKEAFMEEKSKRLEWLTSKVKGTTSEKEKEEVYLELIKVREWLLKNSIERPSLSEERLEEDETSWKIINSILTLRITKTDYEISVKLDNCEWKFFPLNGEDIILGNKSICLASAGRKEVEPLITGFSKGYIFKFTDFVEYPEFVFYLTLQVERSCLTIEIFCANLEETLSEIRFPKPIVLDVSFENLSVLPLMQGALLPSNYPQRFFSRDLCNTRTMYMPWWAHIKGRNAVLGILCTQDDAGIICTHSPEEGTKVQPVWYSSMGELRYLRRIEYHFISNADYVNVAKKYREWAMEHGRYVSLKEKISRCPLLAKIIGVPVIHTGALYHIDRLSNYFVKDPIENNHQLQTFKEIEEKLVSLKGKGVETAYVHLDGWGYLGYDSGHPDTVPVGYEVGGADGLRTLAETCKRLGYILALHDNYFSCFLNSVSANVNLAVRARNGIIPQHSVWCGGPEAFLSPIFILPYLKKNLEWLESRGIEIQGMYLDVFSVNAPLESYQPFYPVSRRESSEYRLEAFRYLKSKGFIVSSEEPSDLYISVLDLVHHGPYYLDGSFENGEKVGIPVPLFNLVYHDAIIIPWATTEDGGWGIPKGDAGYLHCVLNAGMPYLDIDAGDAEIKRVKELCNLQKHCQFLEMTNHEFLDSSYRKQRTTFSDGTTITVDFDNKSYEIHYPEN